MNLVLLAGKIKGIRILTFYRITVINDNEKRVVFMQFFYEYSQRHLNYIVRHMKRNIRIECKAMCGLNVK